MEKIAKKKRKLRKITAKKEIKKASKVKIRKRKNVNASLKDVEKIWMKLGRLEDRWSKSWRKIDKIDNNVKDLISETRVIKMLQSDTDRVWEFAHGMHQNLKGISSKLNSLTRKNVQMLQTWEDEVKATHEKVNKFEDDIKSVQELPKFYKNVNEQVSELEKQYNMMASDAIGRFKELEEVIKPEKMKLEKLTDLDTVKDQVEGIRKSMLTFNKLWSDYKKEIDNRLGYAPTTSAPAVMTSSPIVVEEVKSLRDIVNKLSLENDQIKKMTRDIRVSQMESPNTEVMVNLTSRLNTAEKKITEVEEEFSKLMKNKPVVLE